MIDQATKDRLLADAQVLLNDANALQVDAGPAPTELQAQLDAANATIAAQRQALTEKQGENDNLTVALAAANSKLDIIRAALA